MKTSGMTKSSAKEAQSRISHVGDTLSWAKYLWNPFIQKDGNLRLSRRAFEELEGLEIPPGSSVMERTVLVNPEVDILGQELGRKCYNRLLEEMERNEDLVFLITTAYPLAVAERGFPINGWIGMRVGNQSTLIYALGAFSEMTRTGIKPTIAFLVVGKGNYWVPRQYVGLSALAVIDWIIIHM